MGHLHVNDRRNLAGGLPFAIDFRRTLRMKYARLGSRESTVLTKSFYLGVVEQKRERKSRESVLIEGNHGIRGAKKALNLREYKNVLLMVTLSFDMIK